MARARAPLPPGQVLPRTAGDEVARSTSRVLPGHGRSPRLGTLTGSQRAMPGHPSSKPCPLHSRSSVPRRSSATRTAHIVLSNAVAVSPPGIHTAVRRSGGPRQRRRGRWSCSAPAIRHPRRQRSPGRRAIPWRSTPRGLVLRHVHWVPHWALPRTLIPRPREHRGPTRSPGPASSAALPVPRAPRVRRPSLSTPSRSPGDLAPGLRLPRWRAPVPCAHQGRVQRANSHYCRTYLLTSSRSGATRRSGSQGATRPDLGDAHRNGLRTRHLWFRQRSIHPDPRGPPAGCRQCRAGDQKPGGSVECQGRGYRPCPGSP